MCVYAMCIVCATLGGQKMALDHRRLQLLTAVSHQKLNPGPLEEQPVLSAELSPQSFPNFMMLTF